MNVSRDLHFLPELITEMMRVNFNAFCHPCLEKDVDFNVRGLETFNTNGKRIDCDNHMATTDVM